ncbi:alpha/beta hydrolase [Candidatus Micrarchaeota archaeon]|nr:alpha/beta hydrolase [Candidatus Micrarchaeota archaeon]
MKFFIFHCWGGDGRSCWSGWLQEELRVSGLGSGVLSPDFPDTENPRLSEWLAAARRLVPSFEPKDEWVLVSHSLGGPTILRLLESFGPGEKAKAVILVAGFAKDLGIPQIRNFVDKEFDWDKIRDAADRFILINSDNDQFIPLDEGRRMAKMLGAKCEFLIEHGAGHINEGAGFTSYPRLLEIIKKIGQPTWKTPP